MRNYRCNYAVPNGQKLYKGATCLWSFLKIWQFIGAYRLFNGANYTPENAVVHASWVHKCAFWRERRGKGCHHDQSSEFRADCSCETMRMNVASVCPAIRPRFGHCLLAWHQKKMEMQKKVDKKFFNSFFNSMKIFLWVAHHCDYLIGCIIIWVPALASGSTWHQQVVGKFIFPRI